jgi:DNA-binding NarL/FixJ family response regulator
MRVEPLPARLLIVEDSGFLADALQNLAAMLPTISILGHATNAADALALTAACAPTMVSLDLRISAVPDGVPHSDHGLAVLQQLKASIPSPQVVILSGLPEQPWLSITARAGAVGFVSKESSSAQIVTALTAVAAGLTAYTPAQLRVLASETPRLSQREYEVLRLLGEGLSNQQIAEQLQISIATVRKHVENVCDALGTRTRGQAVATARRSGLL